MTQPIPTYVHAVGDYLTSLAAPYAARRLSVRPRTRRIVDAVAALTTAQSLMTDYEGGAVPMVPMQTHLTGDVGLGVGLLSAAVFLRNTPLPDRRLLAGLGAFSVVYALLTNPQRSSHASGDALGEARFTGHGEAYASLEA